jgi:UDP-N-acetylglucosamine 2-epimerase (non-hydrolysing)
MVDNLLYYSKNMDVCSDKDYILVELHRPANVDNAKKLTEISIALSQLADRYYVIFTVHPRTRKMIDEYDLWDYYTNIDVSEPMGYFDFHKWMKGAACVITDSDGIQQETSILDVSCLAIRDTSNIPYTIKYGTTQLCEPDRDEIFNKTVVKMNMNEKSKFPYDLKRLNDGKSCERIAKVVFDYLNGG